MSLNVLSLSKQTSSIRENIENYEHHYILCFNETNCLVDKLPNGIADLTLDAFHEPIIKAPIRASGRGGGLEIYVNKRVCDMTSIETLDEPQNTSGEFQLTKIKECKRSNRTVIIENVYCSPSRKPDSFNTLFDSCTD